MLAHQLELLSPARTADIGIEAINHGADAVYIGGPGFGARSSADNSVDDIARLVAHAHRFHSRIFVTVNTILRDDELEPARKLIWQLHDAGVDALIVQDMGLLELDLPPIQLHASTQCDIRTPEKARFLQDAGFSQLVLAREMTLEQIAAVHAALGVELPAGQTPALLEYFIHGALCVAYSGQCYISEAQTGRSANRGDCSQACRLPYQVVDSQGRFVAHDKHVLSMKDNNQSGNLEALIDAGIRSFKIEGRYKDMGYVKNITAHYRLLLDDILNRRPELSHASSGHCSYTFTPDPNQNFNREFTDYFANGRQVDIGAFDSPKNPGQPIGWVIQASKGLGLGKDYIDIDPNTPDLLLHNGDGLCYYDQQKELVGVQINRAEALAGAPGGKQTWRVYPKDPMAALKDLRKGREINRNRSMDWVRTLDKKSAERRIPVWVHLKAQGQAPSANASPTLTLTLTDADGCTACASVPFQPQAAHAADRSAPDVQHKTREQLTRLGDTVYQVANPDTDVTLEMDGPWFLPASLLNGLRRQAVAALDAQRLHSLPTLTRRAAAEPPAPYPEDTLTYLANVYNHKARDFYARHGVRVIEAAYESHEETGEVSLMITKHCVRFSLSLCPKQAKGVTGVQGTVRAEPLTLVNGKERLTLRFDCKPCEMHVVGRMRPQIAASTPSAAAGNLPAEAPIRFYRTRPARH